MKKILFLLIYGIGTWLVAIFIFGESGMVDNIYQEKKIVHLKELVLKSKSEIESMSREYGKLLGMKSPDQAFLIAQGRKTENIVVFKKSNITNSNKDLLTITKEKKFLLYSAILFVVTIILGGIGISIIIKKTHYVIEDEDDNL